MADQGRAKVGFGDALTDFDPGEWSKEGSAEKPRPSRVETRKTAEAVGFRSREPVKAVDPAPVKVTRRKTGRTDQLNIRMTEETKAAFKSVADAMGWSEAVAFEKAVELMQKHYKY